MKSIGGKEAGASKARKSLGLDKNIAGRHILPLHWWAQNR